MNTFKKYANFRLIKYYNIFNKNIRMNNKKGFLT
jgi:hypothetical protein